MSELSQMLSYGCSPSCVNGVADEAALNFSAEFMQIVISLSLADETRDEMTARAVWARAFQSLNHAANAFRATPLWEPPRVLAQVMKKDAIEQSVGDDESPATTSSFSHGHPAPDETIAVDMNPGVAPASLLEESHRRSSPAASPQLKPGTSTSHSPQIAPLSPAVPTAAPHTLSGTPTDGDAPGRTSPTLLPTDEGATTAISTGENPRIVEVVFPHLLSIRRQAAPEDPVSGSEKPPNETATQTLASAPLSQQSDNEKSTSSTFPSAPVESTGPTPKPAACDSVDPPAASPVVKNAVLSSENPPPSSATAFAPIEHPEKRVHWGSANNVSRNSDNGSALTSLDNTTEDEKTENESEDANENESEDDFEINQTPRSARAKGGSSTFKVTKGKTSALAAKTKGKMPPAAQKRMPERMPR
jgi:hypothetical protein